MNVVELLWDERPPPRRGPRPTLTVEAIASAAIEIADAEGLAGVTMERTARAVGVTKMAVYRYVPGKVELVALMTDLALGDPPHPDTVTHGWRAGLDAWARELGVRLARHPWVLETTLGARVLGPRELGWTERAVAALAGTGLAGAEMLDVVATVVGHIRTMTEQATASATGTPEQDMDTTITALLRGREDRFPALVAALASTVAESQDQALDFGLERILDGVELLVAARAGGSP
ncbi:MAG: TetR family transcriptional regulator [Streptosporangiales bacterium]|nr:TetR family transcriptional regulator [Streptosporangiales bacterium]